MSEATALAGWMAEQPRPGWTAVVRTQVQLASCLGISQPGVSMSIHDGGLPPRGSRGWEVVESLLWWRFYASWVAGLHDRRRPWLDVEHELTPAVWRRLRTRCRRAGAEIVAKPPRSARTRSFGPLDAEVADLKWRLPSPDELRRELDLADAALEADLRAAIDRDDAQRTKPVRAYD